jgi:ankyrin repeat protein
MFRDSKPQTDAQGAGIEVQARLPGQPFFDSDDAPVGSSDAAAGLADAQVQPSVSVDSPGPTPSDAADTEKRMLDAIGGAAALEQGPRAVVVIMDAMWAALPKGKAYDKIYNYKDHFEELPISAACAMDQSPAVIFKLMEVFPGHIRKKDTCEMLPLHFAAWNNSNVAVILELLEAYPEAAREKDRYGKLPLHFAAWNNSNEAVILEVLKAHPEAAREKDYFGKLPLYFAAGTNSNVAVISELLKAYPEAAREKNKDGRLPLHFAANDNCNVAVILEVLKAYPEAAREKDKYEQLPLHLALQRYTPNVAVILEVLKAYPEAAREKDENGLLPVHFAAENNSNVAVLLELLEAYPDALLVVDFETKNKCLSALSRAGDLSCSMITCMHPLHASIRLSAELMAFSRRQQSRDIRLANDADENAAELEQLACAIARGCKGTSRQEMDDCLQLAADLKLKFFISEPACSRRIEELWWTDDVFDFLKLVLRSFFWYSGLNFVFNRGPSPPCSFSHEPCVLLCFPGLPPAAARPKRPR